MLGWTRILWAICWVGASTTGADERLTGIACRSVHLAYEAPEGVAFRNEVTVERSAEGTYFCAIGFQGGYFGIQEQSGGKKVAIFSVWDPGDRDDPGRVPEEERVRVVERGEGVRVGRFGHEGTGGQSFLDVDWKAGETYRFLVTAGPDPGGDESRTAFAAYLGMPGEEGWRKMATFSTVTNQRRLGGYYSFVEDFRRNRVSATKARRARYGPAWVKTEENGWSAVTRARFTADSNRATNIEAGACEEGAGVFFLATGGETREGAGELGRRIEVRGAELTPEDPPATGERGS